MMPEDLSLLDQLEEWLEAQVPQNLNDLPYRMLATMERVSNELFETLNIQSPQSISIPFPPFSGKDAVPPPPPPSALSRLPCTVYSRAHKLVRAHPYAVGTGAALAMTLGLGVGSAFLGYGGKWGKSFRQRRKFGTRGVVEDGMLKEAIVLLSPSPMPPLLWTLTATLLKAGYVVLVAVPTTADADALEQRFGVMLEKTSLRVLIYDPDDSTTFTIFQRSLLATLSLRFAAPNALNEGDAHPQPDQNPHIHAFVSLYPLNPAPPTQPNALPALPTLLAMPNASGRAPLLVTLYPSGSVLVKPDDFASQILTANHRLLGRNLAASYDSRVIDVFVGHLTLPTLLSMIGNVKLMIYRLTWSDKWRQASVLGKLFVAKDAFIAGLANAYSSVTGNLGIGAAAKDYKYFERKMLRVLKSGRASRYSVGQYPHLPFILSRLPPVILPRLLSVLPAMPGPTGPLNASVQGLPAPRKPLASMTSSQAPSTSAASRSGQATQTASASDSDHDSGEDLGSSIHSLPSVRSQQTTSSRGESLNSGIGLDDSWAQLDAEN